MQKESEEKKAFRDRVFFESFQQNIQLYLQLLEQDDDHPSSRNLDSTQPTGGHTKQLPFFDVIAITAIDSEQERFYQKTVASKILKNEIPSKPQYFVFADPPSEGRIGSGGATLHVLSTLAERIPDFLSKRILLIHAGGFSKRLPNHSTTGKLFCNIPLALRPDMPTITMLEVKLIQTVTYCQKMTPGVFAACADDIEFTLPVNIFDFSNSGFTCLAHPSPVEIGTTHGVFVLEEKEKLQELLLSNEEAMVARNFVCRSFLHKPTVKIMDELGAFLFDNVPAEKQIVFTDSAYFFSAQTAQKLVEYYKKNPVLDCEIDAYGDFLQPLGTVPFKNLENLRTTSNVTPQLTKKRGELFDLLQGEKIQVIALIPSFFVHIGTREEYIEHFCQTLPRYGFSKLCVTALSNCSRHKNAAFIKTIVDCPENKGNCSIAENVVLENCKITPSRGISVGQNCILSQVYLEGECGSVPANVFLHTVFLKRSIFARAKDSPASAHWRAHNACCATIATGWKDEMKSGSAPEKLQFHGVCLGELLQVLGLETQKVWHDVRSASLWNAKLFPVCTGQAQSSRYSLQLIYLAEALKAKAEPSTHCDMEIIHEWKSLPLVSIEQAVQQEFKDLAYYETFHFRHHALLLAHSILPAFRREQDVAQWPVLFRNQVEPMLKEEIANTSSTGPLHYFVHSVLDFFTQRVSLEYVSLIV